VPVNAGVVDFAIYGDPIRLVDAPSIPRCRAYWKSRSNLDPAVLFLGYGTDLGRDLGEVLILTEDQSDIVLTIPFSSPARKEYVEPSGSFTRLFR